MTAVAFAPGHATLFFAPHRDDSDPLRTGSVGGGFSLAKGAYARVEAASDWDVRLHGHAGLTRITEAALRELCPEPVRADLRIELPLGSGFGMSAAGTLAACLAACFEFDLDPNRALEVTHAAEVTHGGGLGDAVGSWFGSGELRVKPGCPPQGWAMNVAPGEPLHFGLGGPLSTKDTLERAELMARSAWVPDRVQAILEGGRGEAWQRMLEAGQELTDAFDLLSPELRGAVEQVRAEGGMAGQVMLGNMVWSTVPLPEGIHTLEVPFDPNGARMVRSFPTGSGASEDWLGITKRLARP